MTFFKQWFSRPSYMGIMTEYGFMEGTPESIIKNIKECQNLTEIENNSNDPFYQNFELVRDEIVNGYKIKIKRFQISKEQFESDIKEWVEDEGTTFEKFYKKCQEKMCSEWCKQDEHGECFGGYWDYPEGSDEKINAFNYTQRKNILELYKLPYPIVTLLLSIDIGCSNRGESVAYSNNYCVWIERKYKSLNPDTDLPRRIITLPENFNEEEYIKKGIQCEVDSSNDEE